MTFLIFYLTNLRIGYTINPVIVMGQLKDWSSLNDKHWHSFTKGKNLNYASFNVHPGGCNLKTMSRFLTCVNVPGHYQNKLAYLVLSGRYFYSCVEADLTE